MLKFNVSELIEIEGKREEEFTRYLLSRRTQEEEEISLGRMTCILRRSEGRWA